MILSVCSAKGGIGKTTTAVNLAGTLSREKSKCKILIVDWDSQAGATHNLSFPFKGIYKGSLYDVFRGKCDAEFATHKYAENLFIIPTEEDFAEIKENIFEKKIEAFVKSIKARYDFIFFDLSPANYFGSMLPLAYSDLAIVPCATSGGLSILGVQTQLRILDKLREKKSNVELLGILPTIVDRTKLSEDVISFLRKEYKKETFSTIIRKNTSLAQASALGKVIYDHRKTSNGAKDYKALGKEILGRIKKL